MIWPVIMLDRGIDAAELHLQMRLGQAAIAARPLQRGSRCRETRRRHGWRCAAPDARAARRQNFATCGGLLMFGSVSRVTGQQWRHRRTARSDLSAVCLSAWVISPFS